MAISKIPPKLRWLKPSALIMIESTTPNTNITARLVNKNKNTRFIRVLQK